MTDKTFNKTAIRARLAEFEQWTGTKFPPLPFTEMTDEFLEYCNRSGLSLDWIYLVTRI